MAYGGTSEVERILRINSLTPKITIGTAVDSNLGTADIRKSIDDADRYIDAILVDTIDTLPVSPTPGSLKFASEYLAAYFIHTQLYGANMSGEVSPVIESWRELAEKSVSAYRRGYGATGREAKWTKQTRLFRERGVAGIDNGVLDDDDDVETKIS